MSVSDANVFPIKNQAFRLPVVFRDNTGAVIAGWSSPSAKITVDGATAVTGSSPVENKDTDGATGLGTGYLDLTAAQMNGELIQVKCTISNGSALAFAAAIYTGALAEIATSPEAGDAAGRALTWQGQVAQIWRYLFNKNALSRGAGTHVVYRDDGSTPLLQGGITSDDSSTSTTRKN